ncbi:MAG: glutathione S-transferase N-terminal domain-containing protein [Labilithrix sp.]|nr:glutathione S-transferase N-terminal domain-containing protein [Labilithrix sp.]MCW5815400.1 glutathione S-transferase N-terminal domain-containing protein [Labilithrix sp.]
MIDLYFWGTPNGQKVSIALEELALPYVVHAVNIGRGDQFTPEFLAIAPNNRIPAIVDRDPEGGGPPISIFESGAILLYLAEKTGKLLGQGLRERTEIVQWLMWQMGGIGPMFGQANHFAVYAPERIPYAIDRYTREAKRLLTVLDKRLADREYVAGPYSIADIAIYPWVRSAVQGKLSLSLADYPHANAWSSRLEGRPAVTKGLAIHTDAKTEMDEEARKHLFQRS